MKKAIVVILTIYLSLVFFMPKKELVYTGLNTLSKQMVNFEIEKANDFWIFYWLYDYCFSADSTLLSA